ncbi:tetratricopeptide repeat protein [Hansschlegelia quercus]|uniref:Tetratricopeptide repeat protein n=2 Tax=Hansschlegelia quercus TaxID=2528245 RepID=A0A4Q9GFZ6_9HYPH|nr:tetratricopeptide repeat protein [Hansschlegelia quercus]
MIRNGLAALLLVFAAAPATAQQPAPPMAAEPAPPAAAPSEPDARAKAVGELLGQLSKAQDPALAKRLAAAVQALWRRSGSDTVDLLTARSVEAQRGQKVDVAIKLMDEVVSLQPDYAEGWNRRATLHYMAKDYDEAMIDIRETLALEPRHFVAWLALGRILKESDLEAKALAAFRKALAINPWIEGLKREVDELALKVEGQPI